MRPWKLFSLILLSVCSLSLSAGSGSCFTTDNVTVTRSMDRDVAVPGSSVTVMVNVTNLEPDSLRGFYYAEEIPQGLAINTVSVKVNGNPISDYMLESGSVGDVYPHEQSQSASRRRKLSPSQCQSMVKVVVAVPTLFLTLSG